MFSFQQEPANQALFDEVMPLLQMHYEEIAHFKDIKLNPDFSKYQALANAGTLRVFTARKDGELVGYAVFFIVPNIHYRDSVQANQDILFINKKHRGFGRQFIKWCDEQLKSQGVEVVYHHIKAAHNFGALLEAMGYELVDLIFAKRLSKEKA